MATPPHVPQPETELEEFFDLSIDPLSIIGFDGEFERVNASFVRLLGYTKPELFSLSALGILHPDDVEPAREALAQLAQGHDVVRFEARVICADGALRWLEWNTRSMPERGVVYSVGRDTTERRRVEAELREAQHVLEASRDELRVLAEEQAALRRVATLVAQDVPSRDLFGAVAREVGTLFGADFSGMIRYEDDGSLTTVATWAAAGEHPLVPTRWEREPGDPAAMIEAAREATRMDDWTSVPGAMAEVIRNVLGVSSSVGCPIVVEGRLWGALAVHSKQSQPLPPDTESRIAQFTDLVDTAIANAESHARADRLAEEQATLRRLATLVAREAPLEAVFAKVAEEVARTLGDVDSALWRDDGDRTVTAVAVRGPSVAPGVRVGTRLTLDGDSVIALVLREGRPHRIDDFSQIAGSVAERARELGMRSAVGCPIVVGSRTWGAMTVATYEAEAFAPETETRVARFSDLVATAIANAEARAEVERLAAEQAALRRVATLVATEGSPAEVLVKIAEQVANLLGDADCALYRDEGDGTATVVGIAGATLSATVHLGTRWPIDGTGVIATVLLKGRQHRIDDHAEATGTIATVGRDRIGGRTAVGCPIVVGGRIWGAIAAGRYRSEAFPAETETALRRFADLAATAVVNAEARAEVERLAEEQAALRGVATLVARGVPPADVFEAIAREAGRLLGVDAMHMGRYDTDAATSVAAWSRAGGHLRVGTRVELDGTNVASLVLQSGRPERIDGYSEEGGTTAERLRHRMRVYCSVAVPILVDGRMWGLMIASSKEDRPLPADTESRLLGFTALAEMAISNTEARTELAASRARVVAAADEERRRVVRDLHDGAQQRLVHTIVTLQLAQRAFRNEEGNAESLLGQALEQAEQGHRELRELAHGILPAVLTRGGLRAGVAAVVDRLDLPVAIDVPAERLPAEIEASAYFIVAEALTNVVKHSHAGRAEVTASLADGRLRIEVRDNGAGGADPDGHGLLGIRDRVTTLGGRLEIESPAGGGTLVAATLPLSAG